MKKLGNKGFTLVEVIASVTIIGILAGSAIYSSVSTFNKAHVDYCNQISDNMVVAARDYFNDFKNVLPNDYGIKSCVNLDRLQRDKYIEELKDYEDNTCEVGTSKVCVLKETNNTFYYSPILDCHKCITENSLYQDSTEAPTIEFTPNVDKTLKNEDLTVLVKYNGRHKKIVSYSYQLYQKQSGGDVIVGGSTDYRKYNGSDTEIKLTRRGTYYVKATAINEDGTKGTATSKTFVLDYTLDCTTKKVVTVSAKQTDNGGSDVVWEQKVWHNRTLKVTFKRNSGAIDNYSAIIYKYDCTGKATCNPQTTNMKGSGWKVHKTVDHATKNKTVTVGKNDANAVYVVEIQGYDTEGGLCSSDKGQLDRPVYYQDNEKPTCPKTNATVPDAKGKAVSYPEAGRNGWTNKTVTLNGVCKDNGGSTCKVASDRTVNGGARAKKDSEFVGNVTPGYVYDQAGNKSEKKCPNVMVKIDQTKPTCSSSYKNPPDDGLGNTYEGKSEQWTNKTITLKGTCTDPNGTTVSDAKSGCKKTEITKLESEDQKALVSPGKFEDYAGNVSDTCPTLSVQIDTQQPKCNGINSQAAAGNWKGIGQTRTVSVKCTDPLKKGVASGCYEDSLKRELNTEGENETISNFEIQDLAGNKKTCPAYTFRKLLDYHAPTCEYSDIKEPKKWSNTSNTVTMGCSDTEGQNGGNSGCDDDTLSKTYGKKDEGKIAKNEVFTIADKAGNEKECEPRDVKKLIDVTPPKEDSVKCTEPVNTYCSGNTSTWWKKNYEIEYSATDPDSGDTKGSSGIKEFVLKSDNNGQQKGTKYKVSKNVEGEKAITVVKVCDNAGNCVDVNKNKCSAKIDTKPPRITSGSMQCSGSGVLDGFNAYYKQYYADQGGAGLCKRRIYCEDNYDSKYNVGNTQYFGSFVEEGAGTGCHWETYTNKDYCGSCSCAKYDKKGNCTKKTKTCQVWQRWKCSMKCTVYSNSLCDTAGNCIESDLVNTRTNTCHKKRYGSETKEVSCD